MLSRSSLSVCMVFEMKLSAATILMALLWTCDVRGGRPTQERLPEGMELEHVSVVYRHGDWLPLTAYPGSEFSDPVFWPDGIDQLTIAGMRQHLRFGRWLMYNYGPVGKSLLHPVYHATEYKIFSTDSDRTIMSGLANTAGIYHPSTGYEIDENIEWRPIPIRAITADEDDQIFAQKCPLAKDLISKNLARRFENLYKERPELFKYAEKHSGYDIEKYPARIAWLYNTLMVELTILGVVPEWSKPIFPEPLAFYDIEFYKQYGTTDQLKRLTGGPLLKTILVDTMLNMARGKETKKLICYSAHQTTVYNVLNALGIPPKETPGYTSAAIFELYKSREGIHYVRLLYRNEPDVEPYPLEIPNCGAVRRYFCRLETLVESIRRFLPVNLKKECQLHRNHSGSTHR